MLRFSTANNGGNPNQNLEMRLHQYHSYPANEVYQLLREVLDSPSTPEELKAKTLKLLCPRPQIPWSRPDGGHAKDSCELTKLILGRKSNGSTVHSKILFRDGSWDGLYEIVKFVDGEIEMWEASYEGVCVAQHKRLADAKESCTQHYADICGWTPKGYKEEN